MGEITRAATSDEDWATAPVPAPTLEPTGKPGDPKRAINALERMIEDAERLGRYAPGAAAVYLSDAQGWAAVSLVAAVQDLRRRLALTEAFLARQIGRDDVAPREGTLPDGRTYEVRKGAERKAWEHAEWQTAVRRQVLSGLDTDYIVNTLTGESVDVPALLAAAQEVHGSTAPKTSALKRLGLNPDDYAERVPGPWTVQVKGGGPA